MYQDQKATKDYLTDEELEPIIKKVIDETVAGIGDEYKDFLIRKYFGTNENLIKYIVEDVYVDLVTEAINKNVSKIRKSIVNEGLKNFGELNRTEDVKKNSKKK